MPSADKASSTHTEGAGALVCLYLYIKKIDCKENEDILCLIKKIFFALINATPYYDSRNPVISSINLFSTIFTITAGKGLTKWHVLKIKK